MGVHGLSSWQVGGYPADAAPSIKTRMKRSHRELWLTALALVRAARCGRPGPFSADRRREVHSPWKGPVCGRRPISDWPLLATIVPAPIPPGGLADLQLWSL